MSNARTYDADVAIIGFGPTGVSAANSLGSYGISTVAFERDRDIYPRARAVTVNDWTMRHFQSVGLAEAVAKDIDPTRGLQWKTYDGHQIMRMDFPPSNLGYLTAYQIYQPTMEQILRDGLSRHGELVQVTYGVEVTGIEQDENGATVVARDIDSGAETRTRVKYVLACDGGSSTVRSGLGVQMQGDTVDTRWIVIDARVKRWWPDRNLLTFWSDQKHPVVDIALGRGNHRWEIPLEPNETDENYASEDTVWPLLERMGVTTDDVEIHQWAFYTHHVRMADRWRIGRVFLLGDAAHLMPPWAGSGMQSGIRDAFNITWKLHEVLAGRLPESLLDTYQAERQPNVGFYTEVSVQLGRIIKQQLTEEEQAAMAPKPGQEEELPPLLWPPFIVGGWLSGPPTPDSAVGKMIPQPVAADIHGLLRPLDDLLGNGFVILGDGIDPRAVMSPEDVEQWDAVRARYIPVRSVDQFSEGPDDIIDLDGSLLGWMRRFGAQAVAVRPDRFVAAASPTGLQRPA